MVKRATMPILWLLSALAIVAFSITFERYIAEERERKFADVSTEVAKLVDLAALIQDKDRNNDRIVDAGEIGSAKDLLKDFDTNDDKAISRKDGRVFLNRIREKRKVAAKINFEDWQNASGTRSNFNLLDRNNDGFITDEDLQAVNTNLVEGPSSRPMMDPRNGERLLVGGIRLAWLRRVREAHRKGALIWKNQTIARGFFGEGNRAFIDHAGKRYMGFLSDGRTAEEVTLLDGSAAILRFKKSEVTITPVKGDAASEWYQAVTTIKAEDAEAWKALALKFYDRILNDEALWAAKFALLYRVQMPELYDMLGVELKDGELQSKEDYASR